MSTQYQVFQAGVASRVITPELPCFLAGYFHERKAVRVRDDIHARAIVIGNGEEVHALVSCDLVAFELDIISAIKNEIHSRLGIDPRRVMICATHTHTGPEIRKSLKSEWCNAEYDAWLVQQVVGVVADAGGNMFDATLHYGLSEAPGISFNRIYRCIDGSEVFGGTGENIIGPAGPIDPSLQTLSLRDTSGRVRALIVNFACHPDVIGGGKADFVSGDWPGEMASAISAVYGDDVPCLFLQGAAGDINQNDCQQHYLPARGEARAVQMGRALAGAAMLASERADPEKTGTISSIFEYVDIPCFTRDASFNKMLEEIRAKEEQSYFEQALLERATVWDKDGQIASAPILCMRLGDVAVVGFPAEMFTAWGLEVKKLSPFQRTMVVELVNERVTNYVPTTDQANRGAYGSIPVLSRMLCSDAGRLMVECAVRNLYRLWSQASITEHEKGDCLET